MSEQPCSLCARPEADHDDTACSFGWTPAAPPLRVYTVRLADRWAPGQAAARAASVSARLFDITRGSGGPHAHPFAPPWSLLAPALAERKRAQGLRRRHPVEADRVEDAMWLTYAQAFNAILDASEQDWPEAWDAVEMSGAIVLGCQCGSQRRADGSTVLHCHRRLVAERFARRGAVDGGELEDR